MMPPRAPSALREPTLATTTTTMVPSINGLTAEPIAGPGFGLAGAVSAAAQRISAVKPVLDFPARPSAYVTHSHGSASQPVHAFVTQSGRSAMEGPFKFFPTPRIEQMARRPADEWHGLPTTSVVPSQPSSQPRSQSWGPTSIVPPEPTETRQYVPYCTYQTPASSLASDSPAGELVATPKYQPCFQNPAREPSLPPTELRSCKREALAVETPVVHQDMPPRLLGRGRDASSIRRFGGESADSSKGKPYGFGAAEETPIEPPPRQNLETEAPPPRLLGRGIYGTAARRIEGVSVYAEKPAKKTIGQEEVVRTRGIKADVQEPVLPQTNQLDDMQELKVPLEVRSLDLITASKSRSRGGASDVEEMRRRLDAAEAEMAALAAAKARLERTEAQQAAVGEENSKLRDEHNRAMTTVEALQQRLSVVEAEHKTFFEDNATLQRCIEEQKAELERSHQRCLENENNWRETNARVQEVPQPETQSLDTALYEERLANQEEHVRTHSEQLVESEKSLKELRDQLAQAEADRDSERQQNERLLRKQLELAQAAQRSNGIGVGAIHQYKDFKTVRGFRFKVQGEPHKIEIAHRKGRFQLALDGELQQVLTHKVFGTIFKREQKRMDCKLTAPDGQKIDCTVRMEWMNRQWDYSLTVNGSKIPHCWERRSKSGCGHYIMDATWQPPEAVGAAPSPIQPASEHEATHGATSSQR